MCWCVLCDSSKDTSYKQYVVDPGHWVECCAVNCAVSVCTVDGMSIVHSVLQGYWSELFVHCAVCLVQLKRLQYAVQWHWVDFGVQWIVLCAVGYVQCLVYSVQITEKLSRLMCTVYCTVFSVQCLVCRVRQLKGLQLNHFAISCVRTSESGVILSLTTKTMITLTMMMIKTTVRGWFDDGGIEDLQEFQERR